MNNEDEFDINPEDFNGEESLTQIAKMGLSIYRALKRDGASSEEAFTVTSAFFAGFAKGSASDD
jgi:hypothetical protein